MVSETPPQQQQGALVAVGGAQNAAAAKTSHDLESIRKLATQTKAIGVILPPPDIRAIVDKTAQFVAKNGECCSNGRRGGRGALVCTGSVRTKAAATQPLLLLSRHSIKDPRRPTAAASRLTAAAHHVSHQQPAVVAARQSKKSRGPKNAARTMDIARTPQTCPNRRRV
jgi:hypothetical protein